MSSDTIWSRIREKPFRPFKLNTSDGKSYAVFHPEMILLTKSRVTIAIYDRQTHIGKAIPNREVVISPLHVASLEDINGRKARAG